MAQPFCPDCMTRYPVHACREGGDDGERLSCEECGESFNVRESGSEDYCVRCAPADSQPPSPSGPQAAERQP